MKQLNKHTPHCRHCDEEYATERWKLGYKLCMPCGEKLFRQPTRTEEAEFWRSNDATSLGGLDISVA